MRNNTEVRTLAELLVINEGLVKYIQNLKNEVSNKKIINRTVKANGPVSGSSATGEKKFSPNSVLKEFAEAGFTHGR